MKDIAMKFRFYPTPSQENLLARTFGCVRVIYNQILKHRTDAYYSDNEKINYNKASSLLTQLKKQPEFEWLNEVSCVPLQQALRHQQTAFRNFFEHRANYPKFKKKHAKQSAEFTKSAFYYRDGQITLAKCSEPLDVRWSRKLPSDPTTVTVTKDSAGRYFVACRCQFDPKSLPISKKSVGIDLGLKDIFVTSDGVRTAIQNTPNVMLRDWLKLNVTFLVKRKGLIIAIKHDSKLHVSTLKLLIVVVTLPIN